MTNDLLAFLRARLDDMERAANDPRSDTSWHTRDCDSVDVFGRDAGWCDCGVPARVLADVDAKRRILGLCEKAQAAIPQDGDLTADFLADDVLQALATPFADHPEYRPEWAPSA